MITKSSGVGSGGASASQQYWFVENPVKIHEISSKIPEKLGRHVSTPSFETGRSMPEFDLYF